MRRPSPRKFDLIDVVEAVYDLDPTRDEGEWAGAVLEAFRPAFDRGRGVGVFASEPGRPFIPLAGLALHDAWKTDGRDLMTSPAGPHLLHPKRPAITASDAVGREALARLALMRRIWNPLGIVDAAGVVAHDGDKRALTFFAHSGTLVSFSAAEAHRYEQVVAHVVAGWRLRRSLSAPAAVLTPSGKVVHAEGDARERPARERLRHAAIAIDRARGPQRRKGDEVALSLWRVLVEGKWSLVDRFDADGRRYVIARENVPSLSDPRALTSRERQVLAHCARGHSLKLIAYELGLHSSTLSSVRRRAMQKLGITSLTDLARLFSTKL